MYILPLTLVYPFCVSVGRVCVGGEYQFKFITNWRVC